MRAMIDDDLVHAHRQRGPFAGPSGHARLRAESRRVLPGTRDRQSVLRSAAPASSRRRWTSSRAIVGRQYQLFEYVGSPNAERVIVMMGSGAEAAQETVEYLNAKGEKVGLLKVRLFRPFAVAAFVNALPPTVKTIAVLDRTKEPGQRGEPLYQDVITAIAEALAARTRPVHVVPAGHRRPVRTLLQGIHAGDGQGGLRRTEESRPEESLHRRHQRRRVAHEPRRTMPAFTTERDDVVRALFYGLGADGTVGANKNSIKIIGEDTAELCPGLLRLRLEEIRLDDDLASAVRPAPDPLDLPHRPGEFRRLPPVVLPREVRHAESRRSRARHSC